MDLTKILAISGKPGLFKVLGQTQNNGIIVESLIDGKRFPAYAANKLSSLEDISIYTEDDDVPLKDIFKKIFEKEGGEKVELSSTKGPELKAYFLEILPDFDQERVYNSDIKKVIKWYNDLHDANLIQDLTDQKDEQKEENAIEDAEIIEEEQEVKPPKKTAKKDSETPEEK